MQEVNNLKITIEQIRSQRSGGCGLISSILDNTDAISSITYRVQENQGTIRGTLINHIHFILIHNRITIHLTLLSEERQSLYLDHTLILEQVMI